MTTELEARVHENGEEVDPEEYDGLVCPLCRRPIPLDDGKHRHMAELIHFKEVHGGRWPPDPDAEGGAA